MRALVSGLDFPAIFPLFSNSQMKIKSFKLCGLEKKQKKNLQNLIFWMRSGNVQILRNAFFCASLICSIRSISMTKNLKPKGNSKKTSDFTNWNLAHFKFKIAIPLGCVIECERISSPQHLSISLTRPTVENESKPKLHTCKTEQNNYIVQNRIGVSKQLECVRHNTTHNIHNK